MINRGEEREIPVIRISVRTDVKRRNPAVVSNTS
jgi:hypothetical protein